MTSATTTATSATTTMAAHLIILVLASLVISVSCDIDSQLIASITCGGSRSFTDERGIEWSGDEDYIGNIGEIPPPDKSGRNVMSSKRVFKTNRKNCYSVKVGKGTQVLVRAGFRYGNYDKKSSPPTFDLQFDGNHWTTVTPDGDGITYREVVYIVKGINTSVCVAQTKPDQFPFISTLEIRQLDISMYLYLDSGYAIMLQQRVAWGADALIRYPDDKYDRMWQPRKNPALAAVLDLSLPYRIENTDNPPPAVLKNAIVGYNGPLRFQLDGVHGTNDAYISMYFFENFSSTQKISFDVYIDDRKANSKPVELSSKIASGWTFYNWPVSDEIIFKLKATPNSTLPPLINAIEVYSISRALANGTEIKDVEGLAELQSKFDTLRRWTGDPCLPVSFNWEWVNCTTDGARPRVTALHLGFFELSGSIPDFSSMDALQTIELRNNSLTGIIPDFLGNFPNLKLLNLEGNDFNSSIPSSIEKKMKEKNFTLLIDKCVLDGSCKGKHHGIDKLKVIVTPILSFIGFGGFWAIFQFCFPEKYSFLKFCKKKFCCTRRGSGENQEASSSLKKEEASSKGENPERKMEEQTEKAKIDEGVKSKV